MHRRIVVALFVLLLSACGGSDSGSSAERAITEFNTDPVEVDASFGKIHTELDARPAELRAAALEQLASDDFAVHYAAFYSLAITAERGQSMLALRPFLRSSDVSERMLAAGSLAFRGDKESLPVLIAALGSEEKLRFRRPPVEAW